MKTPILALLCSLSTALLAIGQVPSLINYQGRLTDANGNPVTGSKNFAISIFDAATGGNLLYSETIGAVTIDNNGIYSFQFGSAGTSNTQVTEAVATTNGTSTTFQKVLDNSPIVAGSVSVSDGTYTWNQSAGSSNEDDFGVAYSTSLRRVTVNYFNGAPAEGRAITATYRYGTSGITGALSSGAEHWMAISVDGAAQAIRQRVLAVPFAATSNLANLAKGLTERAGISKSLMTYTKISASGQNVDQTRASFQLPLKYSVGVTGNQNGNFYLERIIDTHDIKQIQKIEATVNNSSGSQSGYVGIGQTAISLISVSPTSGRSIIAQTSSNSSGKMTLNGPYVIDSANEYLVEISISTVTTQGAGSTGVAGTSSEIKQVSYVYDSK